MNTVCPGFMPHHVRPNRCRRCFKDFNDHRTSYDVSTTFTVPLPRRRRESVGVTETRKTSVTEDTSASFTILPLDRKTRQRSASTSSWFQEKDGSGEQQKEKIDSLFRNAEDSRVSYRISLDDIRKSETFKTEEDYAVERARRRSRLLQDDDEEETSVAVHVRPPPYRQRDRNRTEEKKKENEETDQNTHSAKREISSRFKRSEEAKDTSTTISKSDYRPPLPEKLSKSGDAASRLSSTLNTSKANESRLLRGSALTTEKDAEAKTSSRFASDGLKKQEDTKSSINKVNENTAESKSVQSRFLASKTTETKSTESKGITASKPKEGSKFSEIRALASKFDTSTSKELPKPKPWESKAQEPKDTTKDTPKPKPWESKVQESKDATKDAPKLKPWESKIQESKDAAKDTPKPKPWETKQPEAKTWGAKIEDSKPTEKDAAKDTPKPKPWETKQPETKTWGAKIEDSKPTGKDAARTRPWESKLKDSQTTDKDDKKISSLESKRQTASVTTDKDAPKPKPWESKVQEIKKEGQKVNSLTETKTSVNRSWSYKIPDTKSQEKTAVGRSLSMKEEAKSKPRVTKSKISSSSSSSESEEDESEESSESSSSKNKKKIEIIAAKEIEDKRQQKKAESPADVAFVLKVKPTAEKVTRDKLESTPKKLDPNFQKQVDDLQKTIDKLKSQLKSSEDSVSKLEKEKNELIRKKAATEKEKEGLEKTAADLSKMKVKITELQAQQDEVKDENKKLKTELKTVKGELSKRETPEKSKQTIETLKLKLQQTETLCEELVEENEEIKKEVRDLEQELEELHDNFREDQASEFRGLKKEVETANKNCRVLQFKLRKAEKRCEQLELDRHSLEDKIREFQAAAKLNTDREKLKELEMTKSLIADLNIEMEVLKSAIKRLETENDNLRTRNPTPSPQPVIPQSIKDGLLGKDYESLTHELYDTMERENDLREQLKFSEDEAKTMRRKISALEQENETLMMQMKKLNALIKDNRGKKEKKDEDEDEDDEELTSENLKIQLELVEQEMAVVRRKLEDTEKENENLLSEVKYLQDKVINQPLIDLPELPKDSSSPGVYWEHKVRLLEHEVREARKKMIEREREIERLQSEVEIYRKKASKVMVRSRSLDSDTSVDLKRQLQLVEQEASILRQRVSSLESENDKLTTENKRMTLRLSKKPPLSSSDLIHLENLELKQRMEEQERKMSAMKEELEKNQKEPAGILQDYKSRKEAPTDNENDLITSLKKKMKTKEEELTTLQSKVVQLEVDNTRLNREYKKLKDSISCRKRPSKAVRDSATRIELREVVCELQDEISELQVSLRSREVIQEGLEEDLERTKKEMSLVTKDMKQKETKFKEELDRGKLEHETMRQEALAQKNKAAAVQEQLNQLSKQTGADMDLVKKTKDLLMEKEDLERRARAAEEALEKKTSRLRDTQEKLNATTVLKDEMARSNRMLEAQKMELQKEVDEHRELLAKAEERASDLRSQIDKTERDLTSLRKECNQLRNELEDERTKLRHTDNRQSEVAVSFTKERDDLRHTISELRSKIDSLQQQLTHNEQIYIEKESRLRDDHKRKKDTALREAREKSEAEVQLIREEEKILKKKLLEAGEKLEKAEASLKEANEKHRQASAQHRREKDDFELQIHELEGQIRSEVKRREKLEKEIDGVQKNRDEELLKSRERLVGMERDLRKSQAKIDDLEIQEQKMKVLERELEKSKQDYDDLTSKYDQLEEEFVQVKSRLVADKEQIEGSLGKLRREYEMVYDELCTLKETYNARQNSWIKEKLDIQEQLKLKDGKLEKLEKLESEKSRLKDTVNDKDSLIESYKKEEKHLKEERERLRNRIEELNKTLELQRSERQNWTTSAASRASEGLRDTHDIRIRLEHSEKCHQAEMEAQKSDYEGRMSFMTSEIQNMQTQIANLAAERDMLKSQMNTIEKTAEEVRTGSLKRERARHKEEADLARRKVHELRSQLEDFREQLDDGVLENKNLKLQIETDRNSWEIQMSELKSKINQLEEQKLLESTRGQTRNFAKTRLELAWEKERGELQHLLGESQQLVSDLKTRLQTSENDLSKEKQATRRQLTDMRSSTDKEHQDHRRRMSELHSNLLEVRESHAKLRGMYDRMKKEREILLKEREEWRQKLQVAHELTAKIDAMTQDIEKVSSSVIPENEEAVKREITPEFKDTIAKVKTQFLELQKTATNFKEDERFKRTISFRRAVSAQEVSRPQLKDPSQRWMNPQRVTNYPVAPPSMIIRPPPRTKALQRKSLSLDQSLGNQDLLKIWESECESGVSTPSGSLLSLRMRNYGYESDTSLPDSEYRYGSLQIQQRRSYLMRTPIMTDSEAPSSREGSIGAGSLGSVESVPTAATQKRTLKDKLKLLRRTKSIDVSNPKGFGGSSSSKDQKDEKEKSLRSKISKVLRKPLGRSSSADTNKPALPPRGIVPDVVPQRPKTEKPLSSSRGDLSGHKSPQQPSSGRKTPDGSSRQKPSLTEMSKQQGSFTETPV